jgi:hypothetical protein
VKSGLEEVDPIPAHEIHEPVFARQAAGPYTSELVSQRLGFADTLEGIAHGRFDKSKNPQRSAAIGFNPIPQIISELRFEDRCTIPAGTLSV